MPIEAIIGRDGTVSSVRVLSAQVHPDFAIAAVNAVRKWRYSGPAPLSGTIYDVTGGVMPGVEVTLVDANQTRRMATSAATGRFEIPTVAPGKYVLEARLPGFRTLRHEVELRNAPDWNRVVTLQVGELQETVTISASRLAAPPSVHFFTRSADVAAHANRSSREQQYGSEGGHDAPRRCTTAERELQHDRSSTSAVTPPLAFRSMRWR